MGVTDDLVGGSVKTAERGFSFALSVAQNAIWADNPVTQLATNIVIIVVAMLSSSVGFVVGIPVALLALIFAGVAIARILYSALEGGVGFVSLPARWLGPVAGLVGVALLAFAISGSIIIAIGAGILVAAVWGYVV